MRKTVQTLKSLTTGATFVGLVYVSAMANVHASPSRPGDFNAGAGKAVNVPKFDSAKAPANCQKKVTWELPNVLAVNGDGNYVVMPFDKANVVTHDKNWANDIWIVGSCN